MTDTAKKPEAEELLRDADLLAICVIEYFESTGCPDCCKTEPDQGCIYHVARRLKAQINYWETMK